jgi:hypothetical protein
MKMVDFTLSWVQEDLMQNHHPTNKFKKHTKPEVKNMSRLVCMVLSLGVDWDLCYEDGASIEAYPVQVFQWYRSEHDVPAVEMTNATSAGTGENHDREGRKEYTDNQIQ